MGDKAWKQFERDAAALFGTTRFPANMGGPLDFETTHWAGQCKLERVRSLASLSRLVEAVEEEGKRRGKSGVVCIKHRAGAGHPTPTLVVCTAQAWERNRVKNLQ